MNVWLYALACVVIPMLWGLGVAWATDRIEALLGGSRSHKPPPDPPMIDFHI